MTKMNTMINANLTCAPVAMHNQPVVSALLAIGRRKPVVRQGENSPHLFAAFLCPPKTQAFTRLALRYGGLFWEAARPTAPCRGFPSPLQPVTHALGSTDGGNSLLRQGLSA